MHLSLPQGKLTDSFSVAFGANATVFTPTPSQSNITDKVCRHVYPKSNRLQGLLPQSSVSHLHHLGHGKDVIDRSMEQGPHRLGQQTVQHCVQMSKTSCAELEIAAGRAFYPFRLASWAFWLEVRACYFLSLASLSHRQERHTEGLFVKYCSLYPLDGVLSRLVAEAAWLLLQNDMRSCKR